MTDGSNNSGIQMKVDGDQQAENSRVNKLLRGTFKSPNAKACHSVDAI